MFLQHCQIALGQGTQFDLAMLEPAHRDVIVKRNQALRILKTSSATLPRKFTAILNKYQDDPESLKAAGLAYAIDQIVDLVTQGVAGIHLYTMNDAETAKYIWQATRSLFENGRKVHQV